MAYELDPPRTAYPLWPADAFIVLVAATLPWSTSLPAIFICLWAVALAFTIDVKTFQNLMKRPACALPVAFFLLALIGTLWSSAAWETRIYSIGPLAKLLAIPLLIYHFQRSPRSLWVFIAFYISCILLMVLSWIVAIEPQFALKSDASYGVPVKNYIDQSHEFALCILGAFCLIIQLVRSRRYLVASVLATITMGFFANMAIVTVSRTAIVTLPIILGIFAFLYFSRKALIAVLGIILILFIATWLASPNLRARTASFFTQYQAYEASNEATSIGLRLEFWQKSLRFWSAAPIFGHGTGTVKMLFAKDAAGQTGASAEVVANPHNQTFYTAIQWGSVGVIILYGMWLSHLALFRGNNLVHSIGLLIILQNMLTSLINSHLFDFLPGWIYVLGVGVAGGTTLSLSASRSSVDPSKEEFQR